MNHRMTVIVAAALLVGCTDATGPDATVPEVAVPIHPNFVNACTPVSRSTQCQIKWYAVIGLTNVTLAGCMARAVRECIGGVIGSTVAWNDWWQTEREPSKAERTGSGLNEWYSREAQ